MSKQIKRRFKGCKVPFLAIWHGQIYKIKERENEWILFSNNNQHVLTITEDIALEVLSKEGYANWILRTKLGIKNEE